MFRTVTLTAIFLGSCACTPSVYPTAPPAADAASVPITPDELMAHVRILSSDEYEGREPGTPGETKTIKYIADEFAEAGLLPSDGTDFVQDVPVQALSASGDLKVRTQSGLASLNPERDFIMQGPADLTLRNEEVVFAGYGIIAPEFGRDDYASADVAGKVVLVLPGEPDGFPAKGRSTLSSRALDAIAENKRTYQQWFWSKQLNAYQRGAKAVFILAADDRLAARRRYFEREYMLPVASPPWAPPLSGFLSDRLFGEGGALEEVGLEKLRALASSPTFRPLPLPVRLDATISVKARQFSSHNVVGKIEGVGPECVVLTAHWDGYGRDPTATGDNIWNGAVDDAGGVAQLIAIARRLAAQRPPKRSIYFVAATGEERGFLGSRHFVANSPCAATHMAAALNLDWFYELGRTTRFASHGLGYSSLDDIVDRVARETGKTVTAANAYYAGGDQLPFMLSGVPGFHGGSVSPLIDYPADHEEDYYERLEATAVKKEGNSNEDEVRFEWDLRGAVEDAEMVRRLAWIVASSGSMPCWKVPSPFSHVGRRCR